MEHLNGKVYLEQPEARREPNQEAEQLVAYFGDLSNLAPMDAADMELVGREIVEATDIYRRKMLSFGFVLEQMIELLQEQYPSPDALAEYFMPSSLPPRDAAFICLMYTWGEELECILEKYIKLSKSSDYDKNTKFREKMVDTATRYLISSDLLERYFVRVEQAVQGNSDNPKYIAELEDKFLMPYSEIMDNMRIINEARERIFELRNKIIEGNLRLVVTIANGFKNRGVGFNDLIQEGNLGLMRALEKFDFRLGHKFSTYASWWIRQGVIRSISTHARVIRIPMHMVNTIRDIERVEYGFLRDQGRLPEVSEIAAVLGQPVARISAIVKMARQTVSLQSTVGDDGDSKMTLEHVLKSGSAQPDELVADKVRLESLKQMLSTLSEREQSIIKMRFGLDNTIPKTLVEISRILGVSHERIRQLEKRILEKLRSPECTKYMEGEDMFF